MVLCALSVGCARAGFEYVDLDICGPDCATTWGDFAATLDIPDCPASNPVLTVNTTTNELDGGESITDPSQAGALLSLREAVQIVGNRGIEHTIRFDATVFPATAPGRIIVDNTLGLMVDVPVCLDARRRGVEISWNTEGFLWFGSGSLVTGLTMLDSRANGIDIAAGMQIAGCRFEQPLGGKILVALAGSTIGPGNVFSGQSNGVDRPLYAGTPPEIRGNYFGYDPVSRTLLDLNWAVVAFGPTVISNNVFGRTTGTLLASLSGSASVPLVIEHNYFGVDESGRSLGPGASGMYVQATHDPWEVQVGPGNVIRGIDAAAVRVEWEPIFGAPQITRNVITGNASGIEFSPWAPIAPPSLTAATASRVEGTCAVAGTVEVFTDAGDQGETFVGDIACDGATPWALDITTARGRNLTATLTDTSGATSAFSAPVPVL